MTGREMTQLTCVICGATKDADFFDGWSACIGAPGLSGKVDIDRPECDECTEAGRREIATATALAAAVAREFGERVAVDVSEANKHVGVTTYVGDLPTTAILLYVEDGEWIGSASRDDMAGGLPGDRPFPDINPAADIVWAVSVVGQVLDLDDPPADDDPLDAVVAVRREAGINDPLLVGAKLCSHCNGYGSSLKEDADTCTKCGGSGLAS